MSSDAELRLIRDGNLNGIVDTGEVIASSTNGGTFTDSIVNLLLGSGDYYVQAYQFSGNTNYNLGITVS